MVGRKLIKQFFTESYNQQDTILAHQEFSCHFRIIILVYWQFIREFQLP